MPYSGRIVSDVPSTLKTLQYCSRMYSGASAFIQVMQQRGPDCSEEFRATRGKCGTKNSQPDEVIRVQMVRDVSWGQRRRRWWGKNRVIR